jgi:2-polyprenyl-3-methyl-5-hydroxy-6-metoxy-1,4-benzoquinol methylase
MLQLINGLDSPSISYMTSRVFFESIPIELQAHEGEVQFCLEELQSYTSEKRDSNCGVTVFEIGCGNRTVVTPLVAGLGYTITSFDLHKPSIALAK